MDIARRPVLASSTSATWRKSRNNDLNIVLCMAVAPHRMKRTSHNQDALGQNKEYRSQNGSRKSVVKLAGLLLQG
jgi:hypothetical protein